MKPKRNPINRQGPRNLECVHYGACLDQAVKKGWPHWQCSRCAYRSVREPDDAVRTVNDNNLIYELPPNLSRQVSQRY